MFEGVLFANQLPHIISGVDTKIRVLIPPSFSGALSHLVFSRCKDNRKKVSFFKNSKKILLFKTFYEIREKNSL